MPKKIDSLVTEETSIKLSNATLLQIREIVLSDLEGEPYKVRAIRDLIEDLINEELPELISGNIKAGTIILSKIKERKNNK